MKLLLDQNLSHRLLVMLVDLYPGSQHVRSLGLGAANDQLIWNHARDNNMIIVSKDWDFYYRSTLYGHPPKVLWIRSGNWGLTEGALPLSSVRVRIPA